MLKKNVEKEQKKEVSLLQELCGDDVKLYACLSNNLYENPLTAISSKDLDGLTEEAEKSGKYGMALDKAIFEAAQTPGQREKYLKIVQNLASKTLHATIQEKEKAETEGLADVAASLERRSEHQQLLIDRTEDIIHVASEYYTEKLVDLEENVSRKTRENERQGAEREERKIEEQEKAEREARKKERKKLGRAEKKAAEKQEKIEAQEAEKRKEARAQDKQEAEGEEKKIGEQEEAGREARKKERGGAPE